MGGVRPLIADTGSFILHELKNFNPERIEKKGLNDLVSYVDKQAEQKLVGGLKALLPEAGFITEEGTASTSGQYQWIIDPLDGTTNFIHGLPIFAISVALTYNQQVVLGVVHELNKDECFHAVKDEPAYCNERTISVSDTSDLSEGLIATGFPYYDFDHLPQYLNMLNDFMTATHGLRRLGSAAVDLAYVGCGRFEGFFEYNLNAWDVAAGAFIVQQAGGMVTDFKGGNDFLFGREIVAANSVHHQMLQTINKHW